MQFYIVLKMYFCIMKIFIMKVNATENTGYF